MQYRAILGLKYGNHENDFSTHKPKRCNEFQSSYAATRQCVISFPKFCPSFTIHIHYLRRSDEKPCKIYFQTNF